MHEDILKKLVVLPWRQTCFRARMGGVGREELLVKVLPVRAIDVRPAFDGQVEQLRPLKLTTWRCSIDQRFHHALIYKYEI